MGLSLMSSLGGSSSEFEPFCHQQNPPACPLFGDPSGQGSNRRKARFRFRLAAQPVERRLLAARPVFCALARRGLASCFQRGSWAARRRRISTCSSGVWPASAFASWRCARRFTSTQSIVSGFFAKGHLQGGADLDERVAAEHVDGVEAADAAQLDQVLEVPAYDGVGAGHGGECHVQGVDAGGGGDARAAR